MLTLDNFEQKSLQALPNTLNRRLLGTHPKKSFDIEPKCLKITTDSTL